MATIEMNMLSVITCGSISVRVFCPGMDKLQLNDSSHEIRYPVLWLLHDDGGAALDFLETPAERIAKEHGIFLIAADQHHALCTDMKFGPRYEFFMNTELLQICRNCLPISDDPAKNWIAGVGTGAYGAIKMGLKHPENFSKAVSIHGNVDFGAIIDRAVAGEELQIPQTKESLKAVFGDLEKFHGSANDLFALSIPCESQFFFLWEKGSEVAGENERLSKKLNAKTLILNRGADFGTCQVSLPSAARWLLKDE